MMNVSIWFFEYWTRISISNPYHLHLSAQLCNLSFVYWPLAHVPAKGLWAQWHCGHHQARQQLPHGAHVVKSRSSLRLSSLRPVPVGGGRTFELASLQTSKPSTSPRSKTVSNLCWPCWFSTRLASKTTLYLKSRTEKSHVFPTNILAVYFELFWWNFVSLWLENDSKIYESLFAIRTRLGTKAYHESVL